MVTSRELLFKHVFFKRNIAVAVRTAEGLYILFERKLVHQPETFLHRLETHRFFELQKCGFYKQGCITLRL